MRFVSDTAVSDKAFLYPLKEVANDSRFSPFANRIAALIKIFFVGNLNALVSAIKSSIRQIESGRSSFRKAPKKPL